MSRDICAYQDFESAATPWSVGGAGECTRSTTNPISGTYSMRMTLDQQSSITLTGTDPVKIGHGSRKGMIITAQFQFKAVALPDANWTPLVMEFRGAESTPAAGADRCALVIPAGLVSGSTAIFRLGGADVAGIYTAYTDGTTILTTGTTYLLRLEYRQDRANGSRMRLWLDGALEIDHRQADKQMIAVSVLVAGGQSSGKGTTGEYIWDNMIINAAQEPQ